MSEYQEFFVSREPGFESLGHIPEVIPVLPVRNTVLFPHSMLPLTIGRDSSIKLVEDLVNHHHKFLGVLAQRDPEAEDPQGIDLYTVGSLAVVAKQIRIKDNALISIVQGIRRFRIVEYLQSQPYLRARVEYLDDKLVPLDESRQEALRRNMEGLFNQIVELSPTLSSDLTTIMSNLEGLSQKSDFAASVLPNLSVIIRQEILETLDVRKRVERVQVEMTREKEILELKGKIQSEVQDEVGKGQREYYLREQMKAIQKELGEGEGTFKEVADLKKAIEEAGMPEEARNEAMRELKRLSRMSNASAEYTVTKTYLDWMVALAWSKTADAEIDLSNAKAILDRDHYGLEKIKDRILEYLAVLKLKSEGKAPILCFVGPPGVGKTSLGKSIASALGRQFVRISLGGIRDEAEIRGHRRTYIGALPGQIIQGIRRAGQRNPVFMLDEIDKVGTDFRGDPASALLEVLDPQQNNSFRDHYLDVPFDLSRVLFITTANVLDTIPAALLDRMEVIELSGYTEEEKIKIAEQYLIPRQAQENGISIGTHLNLPPETLRALIRHYTRESGLRNLEREISRLCRKRARQLVEGKGEKIEINAEQLTDWLGAHVYLMEEEIGDRTAIPGVALGLAWTPTGGDILFVEATRVKGKRDITMTGQLGEVMQESVKAAWTWVRSHATDLGIDEELIEKSDLHIHVPEGAIPKDGPSAGVTMATTLVSLLTSRKLRPRVAMTGEITLTGMVLPVGGIKEKVLAAHRLGVREVILPKDNMRHVREDLPEEVSKEMQFHYVRNISEVIEIALGLKLKAPLAADEKTTAEITMVSGRN